jgi:hypothetical protein
LKPAIAGQNPANHKDSIMSTHVQAATAYTRAEALKKLGLSSRTTLTNYCNILSIPHGLHSFSAEEFQKLAALREWRLRGGRISDFFKHDQSQKDCA